MKSLLFFAAVAASLALGEEEAFPQHSNRLLYSVYGNLATLDTFASSTTCQGSKPTTSARYEEQDCFTTPAKFTVGGVSFNSYTIDCGNEGNGYVYFQNNCVGAISVSYSTPVCAVAETPSLSYRFRCTDPATFTKSPTAKPTVKGETLKPTKRPTPSPSKKPTKTPTLRPSKRPTNQPTEYYPCRPIAGTTKAQCQKKLNMCAGRGAPMKFKQYNCPGPRGKQVADGGCQCKGYCGYKCQQSCSKDPDCEWRPSSPVGEQCVNSMLGLQPAKPSCLLD